MAIEDDIKQVDDFIRSGGQRLTFNGKTYTLAAARDLLEDLKNQQSKEESVAEVQQTKLNDLRDRVRARKTAVETATRAFRKGNATEQEVRRAQFALQNAQEGLARFEGKPVPKEGLIAAGVGGQRRTAPDVETERAGFAAMAAKDETTPDSKPTGGAATAAVTTVKKADVDAALASSGLPDTPANRKQIREDLKAGKKPQANWETLVAEQAGEYAYLLDQKYEGVPELLRKAVQEGYFKSEEGKKQFLQEFQNTGYYRNTSQKQQLFDKKTPADKQGAIQKQIDDIRAEYGEIQFDQATLEEIAGVAARNGSSDVELGRLVYRAAFKRGAVSPDFTTPTAAKTALGGNDADRIRAIYRAYGQRPNDEQISRILAQETDPASGMVMTEDMLRNNLRDLAKVSYSPFADLLDRGVSVETIFSPYQQIAARVLEKTPDQVAFLNENGVPTQFASALMGEKPMSLTEWITKLKSDDRYGWQFTTEAKQQATSLVMDLEKKFGYRA
jgi:hypothetical protein